LVEGEKIMLPEMQGEPGAAHDPVGGGHVAVGRAGVGPDIGVVMADEAATVVHNLGGVAAVLADAVEEAEEGLGEFAEIADFGGPVVHFGIDVDGVFAAPAGKIVLIPDALKGGRERAGAAGADEQIAAEVEEECVEIEIAVAFADAVETLIGGEFVGGGEGGRGVGEEVEFDAVEPRLIFSEVSGAQCSPAFGQRLRRVRTDVNGRVVFAEAGGRDEDEQDAVGVFDDERFAESSNGAALNLSADARGEAHAVFATRAAGHNEAGLFNGLHIVQKLIEIAGGRLAAEHDFEGELAGFVGAEVDGDDVVSSRSDVFAVEGDALVGIGDAGGGFVEVEFAAVIRRDFGGRVAEGEVQVAEGLVVTHAIGDAGKGFSGEILRGGELAVEEEPANPREALECIGVLPIARAAVPEGIFVELDAFVGEIAEDHRAKFSAAEGQGAVPVAAGGFAIPEFPKRGLRHAYTLARTTEPREG